MKHRIAHKLLLIINKLFANEVISFVETHETSYKAWPCKICEPDRYMTEGWKNQ